MQKKRSIYLVNMQLKSQQEGIEEPKKGTSADEERKRERA